MCVCVCVCVCVWVYLEGKGKYYPRTGLEGLEVGLSRYTDLLRVGFLRPESRTTVGSEILRTRPDRPWGPPSLLYNEYRVSFPWIKGPDQGVDPSPLPQFSAEVKQIVELYLYLESTQFESRNAFPDRFFIVFFSPSR